MRLVDGEPAAGPWRVGRVSTVMASIRMAVGVTTARPAVVAVDGRSGSGKTTLTLRLTSTTPGASSVHTDDVAWCHAFFDWVDLMRGGILGPLHRGEPVLPPACMGRTSS